MIGILIAHIIKFSETTDITLTKVLKTLTDNID
jgi:hypothetical protein